MKYEWIEANTGQTVEHDHYSIPPALPGEWRRCYSIHFLSVKGAGDSPGGYVRHVPGRELQNGAR